MLEALETSDMPVEIEVEKIQQALAVLGVSTSVSGTFDPATALGIGSIVMAKDTGLPQFRLGAVEGMNVEGARVVTWTPRSSLEAFRQAAAFASSLLERVPPANLGTNAEVLLWLCPARAYVPVLNAGMVKLSEAGRLTEAHQAAYEEYLDAVDKASFAYGDLLNRPGIFQDKVREMAARTTDMGPLTTTFQNVVDAWTKDLPRFEGDLDGGLSDAFYLGSLVIANVVVLAAVAHMPTWNEAALPMASAAYARAMRMNVGAPAPLTPLKFQQALPGPNRWPSSSSSGSAASSSGGAGNMLLAVGAVGAAVLVFSPSARQALKNLFS